MPVPLRLRTTNPTRRIPGLLTGLIICLLAMIGHARADTLYVSNNGNGTLTKVDEKGAVTTVTTNVSGACGAAYDYAGNINVLDIDRGRVYRITKAGNVTIIAQGLARPEDIAINSHDEIFVANSDGTIRRVQPNDTYPATYASGLSSPYGIAIDKNDILYVSNFDNGTVSRIAPGPNGPNLTTYAKDLAGPATLAFGPDDMLYVATITDHAVVKVSDKGIVTPVAKNLGNPAQVAFDTHGTMYVLDSSAGTVSTVDTKTGATKVYAQGLQKPYGMAFDHPLNRHALLQPPDPPPPPPPSRWLIIAFVAPAVLVALCVIVWLCLRKKEEV